MFETSIIELSQSALQKNINFIKTLAGDGVRMSSVIKGNAYGHGIDLFVPMAEKAGVRHFSVFSADEALQVVQSQQHGSKVMIMGHIHNEELLWAIENNVELFIFDLGRLETSLQLAAKNKAQVRIHLHLETGMNRLGLEEDELLKAIDLLKKYPDCFHLEGVCTHYAGAESIANYARVKSQIHEYKRRTRLLSRHEISPKYQHTACSAALVSYPQTRMDMVRVGILQYGFFPTQETLIQYLKNKEDKTDPLARVLNWKSRIMSTKEVSTGEFVGYGTTYMAAADSRIAVVPVGYAQGYSRLLSNQGRVLICGKQLSVIGTVNMNLILVDLTEAPEAQPGDEVVLIGSQGDLSISVASFGEFTNQLNYELLTRLPMSIPRKVVS
ncbi:alanine racemase [Microscilla marina]|uniref:Alanine racemase n=1 Tax=Microscilla marina ATCC 23134 TaxID=313606 RepID=A1ZXV2_MICM2|nr:alanine racemase [Microscilla marina]EAY24781.1 alanine racemase [Microscilla marina ATCC 23134]